MKNFVIYLSEYQSSVKHVNYALSTGLSYGWNLQPFDGINGQTILGDNWAQWKLSVNSIDKKCKTMMERPGVRGCFLSHYSLWQKCVYLNAPIGIFEHDIEFTGPPPIDLNFADILKLEGFLKKKPRPAGEWYEGARAYIIQPQGAKKLISWAERNGALPADVAIGLDVVNIKLDLSNRVKQHELYGKTNKRDDSFTWNLENMT